MNKMILLFSWYAGRRCNARLGTTNWSLEKQCGKSKRLDCRRRYVVDE